MLKAFFNKKEISKTFCNDITNGIIIGQNSEIRSYCPINENSGFLIDDNFNYIWLNTDNLLQKQEQSKEMFSQNKPCSFCNKCIDIHPCKKNDSEAPVKSLHLNHWQCCIFNCGYCNRSKTDDISTTKHFDIMPVIEQLLDKKLIDTKTEIVFDCGDATLHPEFDKLIYFFINYEMKNIVINTSALRYCHSISEAIGKNIAKIIVPVDGSCSFVYEKAKGLNRYELVMSNVKRYMEFEDKNQKRIIFKYTLMQGINDNNKEFLDFFIKSKNFGIKKLYLDIEQNWFERLMISPQNYINDIILFAENISKMNDFDIEFSPKVKLLRSIIK